MTVLLQEAEGCARVTGGAGFGGEGARNGAAFRPFILKVRALRCRRTAGRGSKPSPFKASATLRHLQRQRLHRCAEVRVIDLRSRRHPSQFSSDRHILAFSRHVLPELCFISTPLQKRAQGRPGAGWHPRSVRKDMHTGGPQVPPEHPAFPARWFYGFLRALPGETGSIATLAVRMFCGVSHRSVRGASARLDASFGRQDHTTSPSAHVFA
jgi:hypothetical protein